MLWFATVYILSLPFSAAESPFRNSDPETMIFKSIHLLVQTGLSGQFYVWNTLPLWSSCRTYFLCSVDNLLTCHFML